MGTAHVKSGDDGFRPPLKVELAGRDDTPVCVTLTVKRVGDDAPFYVGPADAVRVGNPLGSFYNQGLTYAIPRHVWDEIYKREGEWEYEVQVEWPGTVMTVPTEGPSRVIVVD